jgi:hypothetical protein
MLIHFPESGHNGKTLQLLAGDWFELLSSEGVTSGQFTAGIKYSKKTCSFFPKVADVMKGVMSFRESPPAIKHDQQQLTDTTSNHDLAPEEISRNKERIGEILKMLRKETSVDKAVEAVKSKNHIGEFGRDKKR